MRRGRSIILISKRLLSNNRDEHIRKAQASEIFRYAYYNISKSNNNTISVSDLDDLVSENRVRPSPFIGTIIITIIIIIIIITIIIIIIIK
jgi:hypothetical protein